MFGYHLEAVFLHDLHGDVVGCLKHLQNIVLVDVLLQPSLAVAVQLQVSEPKEVWSREDVEAVLRRHLNLSIVDVLEQRVECVQGGNIFAECHLNFVILRHKGAEESLKVGTASGQDGLVSEHNFIIDPEGDVGEGPAIVTQQEGFEIILEGGRDQLFIVSVGVRGCGAGTELLPADDLHHEGRVQVLERTAHDHLTVVAVSDDEAHAELLHAAQLQLRGVLQDQQNILDVDRGLDVLCAQQLQTLGLEQQRQLVHVHHEQHLGDGHALARVVLQVRVDAVGVHGVHGHLEGLGTHLLQPHLQRLAVEEVRGAVRGRLGAA